MRRFLDKHIPGIDCFVSKGVSVQSNIAINRRETFRARSFVVGQF